MQFPDGEPRLLAAPNPGRTCLWAISCGSRHTFCIWIGHDDPRKFADPEAARKAALRTIERLASSVNP